ncbi:hypothetical protein [Streptomyces sp. NPDC093568]|uniref:hypothetical protein n=1 Tax=Streptomyces sp. NPDC093568 TaxID=3366041 RepID=UPI003802C029
MFVGIDVDAGIAVTGDADSVRPPEPLSAEVAEYLCRVPERVDGLVLALRDQHFDAAGAVHRETLYGELADGLGLPLRQFVPRSVATAASVEQAAGELLVCRTDAGAAEAVLCRASGQVVASLNAAWHPVQGVTRATVPVEPTGRAALLLARARMQPRYRAAPLHTPGTMTVGAVLDAFAPVEQALRAAVSDVLARGNAYAGQEDDALRILSDGELARHPLTFDAIRAATGGTRPRVMEEHAAALGALLVARGSVRSPATARHSVSLRVHRLRRGLLVESDIPLTVPGGAVPMAVLEHGHAVTVDVPETRRADVCVRASGRETEMPCPALRGGRYRLGMHTAGNGLGVLVFRPDGGGEPVLVPLGGPDGGTTGVTR